MDELHSAKKATELKSKVKELESKLFEKDAMIKVLQHSLDHDSMQQSILAQRPNLNKHTRSVSSMGLVNSSTSNSNTNSLVTRNLKNLSISNCPTSTSKNTVTNRYSDLASSNSASSGYSSQSNNNSSTDSCLMTSNENIMKSNIENGDNHPLKFDKRLTDKVWIFFVQ